MKSLCKHCGRSYIYNGHNSKDYCDKHRHQIKKYGSFLDNNPRTKYDPNEFRVLGGITEFDTYKPITGEVSNTFIIDTEDFPKVCKYKWYCDNHNHAATRINGEKVLLHRLIMEAPKGSYVDHIDINTCNNKKENLRFCTHSQNTANRRPYSKFKTKGVEQQKSGKWSAYFRVNNKQYHSPGFDTKEKACFARYLLEQLFGDIQLTQHHIKEINSLSSAERREVVEKMSEKFNTNL